MRKRFIPSVSSSNTIKLYDAETGQLFKMFNTGNGRISGQPVVTESEIYVEVTESGNKRFLKYYTLPHCGLIRSTPLS